MVMAETNYDEGEAFAAGDELLPQVDNERLQRLARLLESEIPDPLKRLVVWVAVLKTIFGDDVEII